MVVAPGDGESLEEFSVAIRTTGLPVGVHGAGADGDGQCCKVFRGMARKVERGYAAVVAARRR
jgi:hypothetical protein